MSTKYDWTEGPDGKSNSSVLYNCMVEEVKILLRDYAFLVAETNSDIPARMIVSMLSHKYHFAPTDETYNAMGLPKPSNNR